jgi:hypothetical protein
MLWKKRESAKSLLEIKLRDHRFNYAKNLSNYQKWFSRKLHKTAYYLKQLLDYL